MGLFELIQVKDRSQSGSRGDGIEGHSGHRVIRAWGLSVGRQQRTVSDTHPQQSSWVTSHYNQLTCSSQGEAALTRWDPRACRLRTPKSGI